MTTVLMFTGSIPTCGEPPKIPHAVILHQEYQDSFVGDSQVQYECEDGHTVEGLESNKLVFCRAGNWTQGPMCSKWTKTLYSDFPTMV